MIHFLVSLVAIFNLLSPVISMPFEGTRFSCRGEFEPVDRPTKHLPEGKSNDVIYIKSGMEHLNISCVLVGQNGENSSVDSGNGWTSITNLAHQLVLVLHNSTWSRTFKFPKVKDGEWKLSVNLSNLSMLGTEFGADLLEEWLYNVELDSGLYKSHGSVVLYDRQVLTHWHLGNPVTNPAEIEALTPTKLLTQSSPCSGNIWVLSPVVEREIYIAVSYRAFTEPHYSWYKLTPLITKACDGNQEGCTGILELKALILTNYHLLLFTTWGLLVSSKMSLDGGSDSQQSVSWKFVNPLAEMKSLMAYDEDVHNYLLAHYSPECQDPQTKCILYDHIDLTYSRESVSIICKGENDFSEEDWKCRAAASPEPVGLVQQIVYNSHTEYVAILEYNTMTDQSSVTIALNTLDKSVFPTFTLPVGVKFTHLKLHPRTMNIFVLGDELWFSADLGATFNRILKPQQGTVFDVIFDSDTIHTEIVALMDHNATHIRLGYGTLESRRVREIGETEKLSVIFMLPNNPKSVMSLTFSAGKLTLDSVSNMKERLAERIYLDVNLAMEFTTSEKHEAYEFSEGGGRALQRLHLGMKLVHKSGGYAVITDHHSMGHGVEIELKVMVSFDSKPSDHEDMLTDHRLEGWAGNSTHAFFTLYSSSGYPASVWDQSDVGKTIVLAQNSNYLIVEMINASRVLCVAVRYTEALEALPGTWRMVDFSAGMWWLEESLCRQIIQVTPSDPQHMITLDLGSSVTFGVVSSRQNVGSYNHRTTLYLEYSNPYIFSKTSSDRDFVGYQEKKVLLTDRHYKKAMSSLMIYYPYSTLMCDTPTVVYSLLLCCPLHKRIVFNYPLKVTPMMLLGEEKLPRPGLLKSLPVNYRPPSEQGIAIPVTSNIYNADPQMPLYKSKFKKSKTTAKFKFEAACYTQAANVSNNSCACTRTRRVSRDVKNSDCITQVYSLHLPGQLYLCFAFERINSTTNQLYLSPIDEIYTITLLEMNGRKDFQIEMMEGDDIKLLSKNDMASSGVDYKTSPYNLRIQMSGSGLYHFRSRVPRYMSYCDLQTEFVVSVDDRPVPYPFLFLMNFGVSIGMGFVMFLVYAGYRINAAYKQVVIKTHKPASCEHSVKCLLTQPPPIIIHPRLGHGSRTSVAGMLVSNRKSQYSAHHRTFKL